MRHPIRTLIGAAIALILLLVAAGSVAAHEVSGIEVRCGHSIHVEGIKFAEELPRVVTVTGPAYSESYTVTTDSWAHNFPIGKNGHYQVDWPNSGDFGPVPFTVDCPKATPRPTPTVVGHTPRPTPPPTDTADAEPALSWTDVGVALLLILALTGYVEWRWPELRNRKR